MSINSHVFISVLGNDIVHVFGDFSICNSPTDPKEMYDAKLNGYSLF